MQATDISRYAGQENPPAPLLKDPALEASLRMKVLSMDLQARMALVNDALRALRKQGIVVAALEQHPLDDGPPRIDLGALPRQQANRVMGMTDASTRDVARQLYSASAYGVRLVWGIAP